MDLEYLCYFTKFELAMVAQNISQKLPIVFEFCSQRFKEIRKVTRKAIFSVWTVKTCLFVQAITQNLLRLMLHL